MQPLVSDIRSGYTATDIESIVRDTSAVEFGAGLELIDRNLNVEEDLTDWFLGGTVSRESYATLHGSASLGLLRVLDWGQSLVRPYVTLDGMRVNLGAYFTDVPEYDSESSPTEYSIAAHDILSALDDRVGSVYGVSAGANVLAAVESILVAQGFTQYIIDQSRADGVMPSARPWPLDDNTTWLTIVNDLLASVGYQGIWSDWDGRLRCQPYVSPIDRSAEWIYYGEGETSQLGRRRSVRRDLWDAPNRWIAVRQNNVGGPQPIEGDGIYTFINGSTGPTSVEARGGRIITAPLIMVDAVDQAALIAAVSARVAADMSLPTTIEVPIPVPNPFHWHFDRVGVVDPGLGGFSEILVTSWSLPLAPSTEDMTQKWAVLL